MRIEIFEDRGDILELWLVKEGDDLIVRSRRSGCTSEDEFRIKEDHSWIKCANGNLKNYEEK